MNTNTQPAGPDPHERVPAETRGDAAPQTCATPTPDATAGAAANPECPLSRGTPSARVLTSPQVGDFAAHELLSMDRTLPVVALTTWPGDRGFPIDPDALARTLGARALVVALRTGEDTWALSTALPKRLDVYGGASRIWWPGLTAASDPYEHPLLFAYNEADASVVCRRVIAAICEGDARAGRFGRWEPDGDEPPSPRPSGEGLSNPPRQISTKSGKPVLMARVTRVEGTRILVRVADAEGLIGYTDEKLDVLAARLRVGDELPVFATSPWPDGTPRFSTQGLLSAPSASQPVRPARPEPPRPEPVRYAVVARIQGATIEVSVDGVPGLVTDSDVSLERLAADLEPGHHLRVRRIGSGADGRAAYTVRGLRVDPWRRLPEVYREGDIVRGAICRIETSYVLVEVLPGAALIVPRAEIDWTDRRHPSQIFKLGDRVNVKILTLEPERRKASGSIKQGYTGTPKPPVAPGPGQAAFLADEPPPEPAPANGADVRRAEQLAAELDSALTDREELMRQLRSAKEQIAELRRENRSAEDRLAAITARAVGQIDPSSSETAFLSAVRVEYARRFDEGDRERYPLARMRVGRAFLESLRDLDGISVEKVVEVCAQVAAQRAHQVPGREVHQLRSGEAGAPTRVRKRDAAKAWRCSLQDNTASARRLHWWDVPGSDGRGRTIEFASVGVHDDMDIPE
ncbi:MAG: hypothetical protein HMLKMBBP_01915 [Planctomycetes bacterium]|nr:hypothetical protein [Planctomycetota bacterium]